MKGFILLIFTCLLARCQGQETIRGCPPKDLFAPCLCYKGPGGQRLTIDCSNVQRVQELMNSFRVQFEDPAEFGELVIEGGPLIYLISDAFGPIKSRVITIRQNVNLTYVQEDTFSGTEDYIELLSMDKNSLEGNEIYSAITQMKRLNFATLNGNRLTSVPERALADLPELAGIDLSNNLISELGREAFADCPNLRNIYLFNNRLTVLPGRILALGKTVPADHHDVLLFLYRNDIDEIAPDTFDGIERPFQINLGQNRFQILPKKVFQPLLDRLVKRNDSNIFTLPYNPFVCDCRMRWILENRDYFKMLVNLTCFDTNKPFELYSLEDLGHCQ